METVVVDDMPVPLPLPSEQIEPPPMPPTLRRRSNEYRSYTPPREKRNSPPHRNYYSYNDSNKVRYDRHGNSIGEYRKRDNYNQDRYDKYSDNGNKRDTPSYYRK